MSFFFFFTFLVAQMVKRLPTMRETQVQSLGWEDLLEKETATHSSILEWKIPWTSLVGYSTWGHKESDTTERLHFTSLYVSLWPDSSFLFSTEKHSTFVWIYRSLFIHPPCKDMLVISRI